MSETDKTDVKKEIVAGLRKFSRLARDDAARQVMLAEIPPFIEKKAALISAHFLLPAGARVVDMACETGEVTYTLALLNPRIEFIGIDRDPAAIAHARKHYRLPNLSYRLTDISIPDFEDESLDGIINSNVLHNVYSQSGYNPEDVATLLERQIRKLKPGGTVLIRDYVMPPEDDFVLLELPATASTGPRPEDLSDADLLVAFSQMARPMAGGYEGFFIEELTPRRDGTRLFRLPHKWAKEFIHRKDYRRDWERELQEEYTFFTWQDYRRAFARMGMRMVFSAPYWNPWVVEHSFRGRFQLYDEDGISLPPPPTNYFIVAQKVEDGRSLVIEERRPSQKPVGDLQIMVVRDKKTGKLHELVRRPGEYCDVIPYRVTPDNRLLVYVRSGYPRPIVNAVNRGSPNLDGKKWSGHLIEPVTMDTTRMTVEVEENRAQIFTYLRESLSLRPKAEDRWFVGSTYFPSPDRIDEAIEPVFIEVENPGKTSWQVEPDGDGGFTEEGRITELDANDIILSSQVGLLPEPRLEMHILELMRRYHLPLPVWIGDDLPQVEKQAARERDPEALLAELEPTEFEEEKTAPARLRAVKAVFVEEGRVGRAMRGLSAQDIEFVVTDEGVENIAVIFPLTRDWDDNLLVALEPQVMPVPNRIGGTENAGAMLAAPSFILPRSVRSIDDARVFIAEKFSIPVTSVTPLGQSYFTHTGIMPQRVYPFTISAPGVADAQPTWHLTMASKLESLGDFDRFSPGLLKGLARLRMQQEASQSVGLVQRMEARRKRSYELSTEKTPVDLKHAQGTFSRILGQRPPVSAPPPSLPNRGKRLIEHYADAKTPVTKAGADGIEIKEKRAVKKLDASVSEVARQLEKEAKSPKPGAGEKPAAKEGSAKDNKAKGKAAQLDLGLGAPDMKPLR